MLWLLDESGVPDIDSLFIYEALYDVRLEILEMMKECLLTHVSPVGVVTNQRKVSTSGGNLLLSVIRRESGRRR